MWTLILSFTIGYLTSASHGPAITSHSLTVPNIRSKVLCEAVGKEHIEKYKSEKYNWFVGVYTCVETK